MLTAQTRKQAPQSLRATIWTERVLSQEHRYRVGMYQRASAVGATPFERLTTMYMGALRLGRQGHKAANANRVEDAQAKAERLSAVIRRLDMCLDFRVAPDLCRNLSQLYVHMDRRLTDPDTGHSTEAFTECLTILETLWDGFQTAENRANR